jgi:UDP-hydrolysing UDP-N-acetyl-D-glucosamine 2-epimerase
MATGQQGFLMIKRVDFITVGRSDYGIYKPVIRKFDASSRWDAGLVVSGGHLDEKTGVSLQEIMDDGFTIRARIPLTGNGKSPAAISQDMSDAIRGLARLYAGERPDLVFVLGDRSEMFAFTGALVPFNIPIAHIHGGELSFGAIDDVFRHAITKMSHLHFAATRDYADRIIRMGEEPWRVTVSGAPGLDALRSVILPDRAMLEKRFNLDLSESPILATFHPVTRQMDSVEDQVSVFLQALSERPEPIIITAPNLDSGHTVIRSAYERFLKQNPRARLVENFGHENYLAMLKETLAMVGNSSSGLIETPSFQLPTLNIGDRQKGRTRARNVVDVANNLEAVREGLQRILDPAFRQSLSGLENPYGDGHAAERIFEKMNPLQLDEKLVAKPFYDGPGIS